MFFVKLTISSRFDERFVHAISVFDKLGLFKRGQKGILIRRGSEQEFPINKTFLGVVPHGHITTESRNGS